MVEMRVETMADSMVEKKADLMVVMMVVRRGFSTVVKRVDW